MKKLLTIYLNDMNCRLIFWCLALIFPLTLLFHPGLIMQDATDSIAQAYAIKPISDWHPLAFTFAIKFTTFNNQLFFIYLQYFLIFISIIGVIAALLKPLQAFLSLKLLILLEIGALLFLTLFPPGFSLIISFSKDPIFNFIFFYGFIVIAFEQYSILQGNLPKKRKIFFLFFICSLAALLRHNGIFLLWGLYTTFVVTNFLFKIRLPKKLIYIPLILIFFSNLSHQALKSLSAPNMRLEDRFPLKKWVSRADYTYAYFMGFMTNEDDRMKFESLVQVEKIHFYPKDVYHSTWPPLPLKDGQGEEGFYQNARSFLTEHPYIWLKLKLRYFKELITTPADHSIILSGDLNNISAQNDLNGYKNIPVTVILDPQYKELRDKLSVPLAVSSYENIKNHPRFFYSIWNYSYWFVVGIIATILLSFLHLRFAKDKYKELFLFLIYFICPHFIVWAPYIIFSQTNQTRYFFISILLIKAQIIFLISHGIQLLKKSEARIIS